MVQDISQEGLADRIGGGFGQGLSSGLQMLLDAKMESIKADRKQKASIEEYDKLLSLGLSPQEAGLWLQFTEQGKSHLAKDVLERQQREKGLSRRGLGAKGPEEVSGLEILNTPGESEAIDFSEEVGLTPKEQVARQEKLEGRSFERNKKYLDYISDIQKEVPKERLAVSQMRAALKAGDFNAFRNKAAEFLGQPALQNASANVVNSASKQFLLSSLAGITGRPNQFLENQITKALINPLYAKQANELILDGIEGLAELKQKEADYAEDLEERYTSQGKEVPRSFQKMVREKGKDDIKEFVTGYEKKLSDLLGSDKEFVIMIAPDKSLRKVKKSEAKKAQDAGYTIKK